MKYKRFYWVLALCALLAVLISVGVILAAAQADSQAEYTPSSCSLSAEEGETGSAPDEVPAIGYGIPYMEQEIPAGEVFSNALLEAMEQAGEEELIRVYICLGSLSLFPYQYNDIFDGVFLTPAEIEEVSIRKAFAEEDVDRYLEIAVLRGDFLWEVKALNMLEYAGMPVTNEQIDEYYRIQDQIKDAKDTLAITWIRRLTTETRLEGIDGTLGELLAGRNTHYYGINGLCTEMTASELQALAKADWIEQILLYYEEGSEFLENDYRADFGLEDWQNALDAYRELAAYDPAWKEQFAELEKKAEANRTSSINVPQVLPTNGMTASVWDAAVANPELETRIISETLAQAMEQADGTELLEVWVWAMDPDNCYQSLEDDSYAMAFYQSWFAPFGGSLQIDPINGREVETISFANIKTQLTVAEINLLAESGLLQPTVIGSIGLYSSQ